MRSWGIDGDLIVGSPPRQLVGWPLEQVISACSRGVRGLTSATAQLIAALTLHATGLAWRGYMEDMGTPCRHPAVGAVDDTQKAKVGDQYVTRRNPFMYFHSVIDDPVYCANHVRRRHPAKH